MWEVDSLRKQLSEQDIERKRKFFDWHTEIHYILSKKKKFKKFAIFLLKISTLFKLLLVSDFAIDDMMKVKYLFSIWNANFLMSLE
jgi:hypothetical protein